jgi:hypothetical protein
MPIDLRGKITKLLVNYFNNIINYSAESQINRFRAPTVILQLARAKLGFQDKNRVLAQYGLRITDINVIAGWIVEKSGRGHGEVMGLGFARALRVKTGLIPFVVTFRKESTRIKSWQRN